MLWEKVKFNRLSNHDQTSEPTPDLGRDKISNEVGMSTSLLRPLRGKAPSQDAHTWSLKCKYIVQKIEVSSSTRFSFSFSLLPVFPIKPKERE